MTKEKRQFTDFEKGQLYVLIGCVTQNLIPNQEEVVDFFNFTMDDMHQYLDDEIKTKYKVAKKDG